MQLQPRCYSSSSVRPLTVLSPDCSAAVNALVPKAARPHYSYFWSSAHRQRGVLLKLVAASTAAATAAAAANVGCCCGDCSSTSSEVVVVVVREVLSAVLKNTECRQCINDINALGPWQDTVCVCANRTL
eukprot:2773-Heterococcus_DN1.PRE.2